MKLQKIPFLSLILICVPYITYAQFCLSPTLLDSQDAIDNFPKDYADCSELRSLTISGYNIYNLDSLYSIKKILGNFSIDFCPNLTSLKGLDNLEYIGTLDITFNHRLKNLDAFYKLDTVRNYIDISNNDSLQYLTGLSNLTSVESLNISLNASLKNLHGLKGLNSIERSLKIISNPGLIDLTGLENIESIGVALNITYNTNLETLNGLNYFSGEPELELNIFKNPKLSECEVNSICNFLGYNEKTAIVFENASGCTSQEEIVNACEQFNNLSLNSISDIILYPNPADDYLYIKNSGTSTEMYVNFYSLSGIKVLSLISTDNRINLRDLDNGMYMVEIQTESIIKRASVIILKQ